MPLPVDEQRAKVEWIILNNKTIRITTFIKLEDELVPLPKLRLLIIELLLKQLRTSAILYEIQPIPRHWRQRPAHYRFHCRRSTRALPARLMQKALYANVRINGIWGCGQEIRPDDHRKILTAELIKISSSKRQKKLATVFHDVDLKDGVWCIAADP